MTYNKMTLVLTEDEMRELRKLASKNLRRPRDQVRYMVQTATGLTPGTNKNDCTGQVYEATTGAIVATL